MTEHTKGTSARETILSHIEHDSDFPLRYEYGITVLEPGYYIVRVDSHEPEIAEYIGGSTWLRCGVEYDTWSFDQNIENIMVHARINMSIKTCASDNEPVSREDQYDPYDPEIPVTRSLLKTAINEIKEWKVARGGDDQVVRNLISTVEAFDSRTLEQMLALTPTPVAVRVPHYGVCGLTGHVLMMPEKASVIEELTAEAESLAQVENKMFLQFLDWYADYTGVKMDPIEDVHMFHSEEFKAYQSGFNRGVDYAYGSRVNPTNV